MAGVAPSKAKREGMLSDSFVFLPVVGVGEISINFPLEVSALGTVGTSLPDFLSP
jgi:hypothetical protein